MILHKKAEIKDALVWSMIMFFIITVITVGGTYFYNDGKLDEQTNNELVVALQDEQKVEETEQSVLSSIIDYFKDSPTTADDSTGGTLEEDLYAKQNQQGVNLEAQYSTLKKAPTIFAVTIFGIPSGSVFVGFLITCVLLYLGYVAYQELKSFFGR